MTDGEAATGLVFGGGPDSHAEPSWMCPSGPKRRPPAHGTAQKEHVYPGPHRGCSLPASSGKGLLWAWTLGLAPGLDTWPGHLTRTLALTPAWIPGLDPALILARTPGLDTWPGPWLGHLARTLALTLPGLWHGHLAWTLALPPTWTLGRHLAWTPAWTLASGVAPAPPL